MLHGAGLCLCGDSLVLPVYFVSGFIQFDFADTDRRRLEFLAYNIEEDLKNKKKSMKRPSSWISDNSLQAIIKNR